MTEQEKQQRQTFSMIIPLNQHCESLKYAKENPNSISLIICTCTKCAVRF